MAARAKLTFPVVSFRHLETPFLLQGYRDYFAIVAVRDLPDLRGWRRINVRDPKMTGAVPKAIREGFRDQKEMFVFMNRGIVLAADTVSFDNKNSVVTLVLSDPKLHGLMDGGHTYNIVKEEAARADFDQYVKLEILEGLNTENINEVVDARNTSNQVADESLMNLQGHFELLRKALNGASYFDDIAWTEYQVDSHGNPKPIDVREIIAILTAFDRDNFNDSAHPINAYRSKAACLKHFKDHSASYKKIYPLAKEILALFDHIQDTLPALYNKVRGRTGDVSGGKFGRLTGVLYNDGKLVSELRFIRKMSVYGVPAGFVYPLVGAFRALLQEKAGRYVWAKGLDPVKLVNGDLGEKLADTIGNFALEAKNPSKTGKSPLVWQACYQSVQVAYLTAP